MNKNDINKIKNTSGIDVSQMKKAAQDGKLDEYVSRNLSKDATEKLKSVLSDKKATEKLLNTPQAKELMKKLMGDK